MITVEEIEEKLHSLKEILEEVEMGLIKLDVIVDMKEHLLSFAQGNPEEHARMTSEAHTMRSKAEYARKRIEVMRLTYDHLETQYKEMV